MGWLVRDATGADAAACAAIYAPYVRDTAITFELEAPTADEMAGRIAKAAASHAWLVLEDAGRVLGYAYGGPYKERAAYRTSVENSVYVATGQQGRGIGKLIVNELLRIARASGFHAVFARISGPSEASKALHASCGYAVVGTEREVGRKFNRWLDVVIMQILLP